MRTAAGPAPERPRAAPAPEPDPWLVALAWLMDNSIPIGRWRIGLDPLIGLIPGFGDYVSGLISMLMIARATALGLPRSAIARMLLNVLLDSILGVIPIAGDLFDFSFKANSRNLRIVREALEGRRRAARDWGFVALVVLAGVVILAVPFVALILLLRAMT